MPCSLSLRGQKGESYLPIITEKEFPTEVIVSSLLIVVSRRKEKKKDFRNQQLSSKSPSIPRLQTHVVRYHHQRIQTWFIRKQVWVMYLHVPGS